MPTTEFKIVYGFLAYSFGMFVDLFYLPSIHIYSKDLKNK